MKTASSFRVDKNCLKRRARRSISNTQDIPGYPRTRQGHRRHGKRQEDKKQAKKGMPRRDDEWARRRKKCKRVQKMCKRRCAERRTPTRFKKAAREKKGKERREERKRGGLTAWGFLPSPPLFSLFPSVFASHSLLLSSPRSSLLRDNATAAAGTPCHTQARQVTRKCLVALANFHRLARSTTHLPRRRVFVTKWKARSTTEYKRKERLQIPPFRLFAHVVVRRRHHHDRTLIPTERQTLKDKSRKTKNKTCTPALHPSFNALQHHPFSSTRHARGRIHAFPSLDLDLDSGPNTTTKGQGLEPHKTNLTRQGDITIQSMPFRFVLSPPGPTSTVLT